MTAKLVVFYELILLLLIYTEGQKIGQSCTVLKTGGSGVCTKTYGCDENTQELGDDPACKSEGLTDVVCCPSESVKKFKTISEQKCAEYAPGTSDKCGHMNLPMPFSTRETEVGEYPHTALIRSEPEFLRCIGSLISEMFVLTVAQCFKPNYITGLSIHVQLGQIDVSSTEWEEFNVVEVISHPSYNPKHGYNDIALVKLDREVKFGPNIWPACLPVFEDEEETSAVATGWGKLKHSSDSHVDRLHKASLDILSCKDFEEQYAGNRKIPRWIDNETQICAGLKTEGASTCVTLYGGNLQKPHHSQYCMYTIIGSASFGVPCVAHGVTDVFTRTRGYVSWIEGIVWPNN